MTEKKKQFLRQAEKVAFDKEHRRKIQYNLGKYFAAVEKGLLRFRDFEKAREQASQVKQYALDNIDTLLYELVDNMKKNGIEVHVVNSESDVLSVIDQIIEQEHVRLVVKSKSMTTEEIDLNKFLESRDVQVFETDLGEFIVQQAGERPYHIVTPAMHKSRQDIARLYHEKFGTPADADPQTLTKYTRKYLREKFVQADMGVTGANFLIADLGAIALTENEGNAFMSFSFPRVHVAIAGFEKIIASYRYLSLMWQVLSNRGTGQSITVYNSIVRGPRRQGEDTGPERMVVILFDNGRTRLLEHEEHRLALKCIRCGACLNYCPIYQNIGGYTYDAVYSGPIGSVLTPFFKGFKEYGHLSFACTVCRKCEEVCPVKIPLPDLLLANRRDYVEQGLPETGERLVFKLFGMAVKMPSLFNVGLVRLKNLLIKPIEGKLWSKQRNFPEFKEPFHKTFSNSNKHGSKM